MHSQSDARLPNDVRLLMVVILCFILLETGAVYLSERARTLSLPYRSQEEIQRAIAQAQSAKQLNINTATPDQLATIPGIGPSYAQAIIALRDELDGFTNVEQLLAVRGIGAGTLENIRPYVKVE